MAAPRPLALHHEPSGLCTTLPTRQLTTYGYRTSKVGSAACVLLSGEASAPPRDCRADDAPSLHTASERRLHPDVTSPLASPGCLPSSVAICDRAAPPLASIMLPGDVTVPTMSRLLVCNRLTSNATALASSWVRRVRIGDSRQSSVSGGAVKGKRERRCLAPRELFDRSFTVAAAAALGRHPPSCA